MDTRTKIIDFEDAVALSQHRPVRWVTGSFDPLLIEHVRRLREFAVTGQLLVVVVTNPPDPLLPSQARAELVAALSIVDYVVVKQTGTSMETEDSQITSNFIQHVLERQPA